MHAADRDAERATLNTYAARTAPDLAACEGFLACTFEGIEKDQILIRFHHLNPTEPDQECSLVLDVSSTLYKGS
jgi:kinetochore protein Spc25